MSARSTAVIASAVVIAGALVAGAVVVMGAPSRTEALARCAALQRPSALSDPDARRHDEHGQAVLCMGGFGYRIDPDQVCSSLMGIAPREPACFHAASPLTMARIALGG